MSPVRSQPSSNFSGVGIAVVRAGDPRAARTSISPTASPSHGSTVPSSSTMRSSTPASGRPVMRPPVHLLRRCRARRPAAGGDTAATGLVSVMPQACSMRMPKRSWNASISARGTAAPPHMIRCSDERSTSWSRRSAGGRPRSWAPRTWWWAARCAMNSRQRLGLQEAAGHEQVGAGHPRRVRAAPHALAWNIGTIGQHAVVPRVRNAGAGLRRRSCAGTWSGASRRRPSGCRWCRSCSTSPPAAHSSISGHVERGRIGGGEQRRRSGANSASRAASSSARDVAVADDDVALDRRQLGGELAPAPARGRRRRRSRPVVGVVDDVRELLGEQPDVERVQHRAHARAPRSRPRGAPGCST